MFYLGYSAKQEEEALNWTLFSDGITYIEVPASLMDFCNKGWPFSYTFWLYNNQGIWSVSPFIPIVAVWKWLYRKIKSSFSQYGKKKTFDLKQYQSPQKRKFPRFKEHTTYSVENIFYVRASSSQTMTKYESRIAQNKGCVLQRSGSAWKSYSGDCKVYTLRLEGRQCLWKSAFGWLNLDTQN